MKAFIDTCDNQLVEQAFTDTKHIGHHEFCDAVTSLRRTAHKEVTHVEALTKVFSEDIGPAIDQLTKALYSYMQSECQCMWGSGYAKSHVGTTSSVFHTGLQKCIACHMRHECAVVPPSHPHPSHTLPSPLFPPTHSLL